MTVLSNLDQTLFIKMSKSDLDGNALPTWSENLIGMTKFLRVLIEREVCCSQRRELLPWLLELLLLSLLLQELLPCSLGWSQRVYPWYYYHGKCITMPMDGNSLLDTIILSDRSDREGSKYHNVGKTKLKQFAVITHSWSWLKWL